MQTDKYLNIVHDLVDEDSTSNGDVFLKMRARCGCGNKVANGIVQNDVDEQFEVVNRRQRIQVTEIIDRKKPLKPIINP